MQVINEFIDYPLIKLTQTTIDNQPEKPENKIHNEKQFSNNII